MARGKNRVTLRDIAEIMGVTTATISKALHDAEDISLETRNKVKQLAAELGYQPNLLARSLVNQRSYLLGVVVPNLSISFFSEVTRGIYERARELGYEAIIVVNDENADIERRNLNFLSSIAVDGILIDAVPGEQNKAIFERFIDLGTPIVAYDRLVDGLTLDAVIIDDVRACCEVVRRLHDMQRRNIVFLGPTEKLYVARGRYIGYRKALDELGIPFDPRRVIPCEIDERSAEESLAAALAEGVPIDAVICVGGLVAYGAGRAILQSGRRIPEDIMLAEFGDNDIVARLGVPFLTVYQHPYRMGREAVDLLVKQIDAPESVSHPTHIVLEAELIYHDIGLKFNNERRG